MLIERWRQPYDHFRHNGVDHLAHLAQSLSRCRPDSFLAFLACHTAQLGCLFLVEAKRRCRALSVHANINNRGGRFALPIAMHIPVGPMEPMSPTGRPSVIYDVGSHDGSDLPYYLEKADVVVAVEANPSLAAMITQKYAKEIAAGCLRIVHAALTTEPCASEVPFYVHRTKTQLSQIDLPRRQRHMFDRVLVPTMTVDRLFRDHGPPSYVKIDVEHYDHVILREMFRLGIRPPYLSAEAHSFRVLTMLLARGGYRAFKIVRGSSVASVYANRVFPGIRGPFEHSFPVHSAGPFGEDVDGDWFDAHTLLVRIARERLGWKDVHARLDENAVMPVGGEYLAIFLLCVRWLALVARERFVSAVYGAISSQTHRTTTRRAPDTAPRAPRAPDVRRSSE